MHYARKFGHDYHRGFSFITINTAPRREFLSRVENARIVLSSYGQIVDNAFVQMAADSPEIDLRVTAIMPDHVHAVIAFRHESPHPLGWHIQRFKARVTRASRLLSHDPSFSVFEENYHDFISFAPENLDAFIRYVKENPQRWQWKHGHPEYFRKHYNLSHWRLPLDIDWTAIGDPSLLDFPWLVPVVVHRRDSDEKKKEAIVRYLEQATDGAVLIGGFISPGEREVAKGVARLPKARIVCLLPYGLKDYKPKGEVVVRTNKF